MKKILFVVVSLFIGLGIMAQTTKTKTKTETGKTELKTKTATKVQPIKETKVDTIELITKRIEKYVVDEIVPKLKDPYSYKPAKTIVTPISMKDDIISDTSDVGRHARTLLMLSDTSYSSSSMLAYYKSQVETDKANIKKALKPYRKMYEDDLIRHTDDVNKERNRLAETRKKYEERQATYDNMINQLNTSTPEQLNKIVYYLVQHDCHANNSYGNPVLGRYYIKYDFVNDKILSVVDDKK
jgi:hypothetical protein